MAEGVYMCTDRVIHVVRRINPGYKRSDVSYQSLISAVFVEIASPYKVVLKKFVLTGVQLTHIKYSVYIYV